MSSDGERYSTVLADEVCSDFNKALEKAQQPNDNTNANSRTIDPPTQIPMARVDMKNESNSYRPLDIPACGSYSGTSCGLTTATLNHTSTTKHNAGPTSGTFSANAGSATNVSTAAYSKHVNAIVNFSISAIDANTCTTHAPSIVLHVYGSSAAASVLSAASVEFANLVRNKFQFQTGNLDSLSSANSVRTSGATASKRKSNKEIDVEQKGVASVAV